MYFMVNDFRHYGYDPGFIDKFIAIIDTGAFASDHFMGFQQSFMNVIENALTGSDPDKMIAVLAICILGSDDVFQLNTFKYRML